VYRYSGCRCEYPQRITGDAYRRLMGLDYADYPEDNMEFRVDWTPENDEYLIELVESGKTWVEIANIFYSIENNLREHYKYLVKQGKAKYRAPLTRISPEQMDYVISQLNKKSVSQLARETGFAKPTIYQRLGKMGWGVIYKSSPRQIVWVKN